MLAAHKSGWFERLFALYNRNLLKRRFHTLNVSGFENLVPNIQIPQLLYANHSSWWDGLVVFELVLRQNLDFYVLMEEKQLKHFQWFRKLGAFSVNRENPRRALESLHYAAELLKVRHDRALLIFPQGKILPNDVRPLEFFHGLSKIVRLTGQCRTTSLAIRYEFLGEFKPSIFVSVGKPEIVEIDSNRAAKTLTSKLSARLTSELDHQKSCIISGETDAYMNLFEV